MKVENVIQHLDQELDKPLSMFKTAQMEGRDLVDENLLRWFIILFQSKFYLSQVAIDTVIKFLDEVHFQTGLRFILVFKKMEDGSEFTPGKHTMLHYEVVEKLNNYTYEFFNSLTGNRKGTLLPPAMMVDLINEHEIFRNHIEWTCFKVSGYISLHYASVSLASHQQHVDESKKRALLKVFDAGRRFFAELLTEKIRRTLMVEMLDPYIQENLAFFYSDPDQVYLFDGGQVKERIRFSFQDISTVFCEGRDEIEKLLNNCNELIDLYQECLGKVKSDQLAQKSFAEVMGLIIKKIRDHQQAKSHPPMQEEINVFSKRRVKQVHNNPIDNEARHSLILKQATGRHQTEEETEETYFYKDIVLNITKALQDMHDRHMKKTLDKLSKDFPDCVLNQHS